LFNPKEDYAVIVLSNTADGRDGTFGTFADLLALHIRQKIDGKPAISPGGLRQAGGR
jgi:hypothetical protein